VVDRRDDYIRPRGYYDNKGNLLNVGFDVINGLPAEVDKNKAEFDLHTAESENKHINEVGSNVNGRYIKFDDGTMICWIPALPFTPTTMSAWGVLYHSDAQTWIFPHVFYDANIAVFPFPIRTTGGKIVCTMRATSSPILTTSFNFWNVYADNALPSNENTALVAIGRWKA